MPATTNSSEPSSQNTERGKAPILRVFWHAYGGWPALFRSRFFWLSIGLLAVTHNFWLKDKWWDQVLSVMPNLLGFTLGGFAIFLAFGDEKFKALISGSDEDKEEASAYLEVSATFLHFVLIQVGALVAALIANGLTVAPTDLPSGLQSALDWLATGGRLLGYWLFLYGICSAAAAAIAIFQVAFWYDSYNGLE